MLPPVLLLVLAGNAPKVEGDNASHQEAPLEEDRGVAQRTPFGTFFALHLEVGNAPVHQGKPYSNGGSTTHTRYQAHYWPHLVRLVHLADEKEAKLTLLAHPQWVEYIAADSSRLNLAQQWVRNGHEWGLHHHGYDHPDWDGFSNRPESQSDRRYRGDMGDLLAIMESLGVVMNTNTPTDRKAEMTDLVAFFPIDVAGKGGDLSVAGRPPNRVTDLCPNLSFVQVGTSYQEHDQPSLDPTKVAFEQSGKRELFGLVTHVWDIVDQAEVRGGLPATDFARWLEFVGEKPNRIETVSALVSRYRSARGIGTGLPTLGFGGGRGGQEACLSSGNKLSFPKLNERKHQRSNQTRNPALATEIRGIPPIVEMPSFGSSNRLKIGFVFHLEGWHWEVETVFENYRNDLLSLADLFDAHNATPTWEVRDEFVVELETRGDPLLADLLARGHGVGVHADLGGNPDIGYTQREFASDLLDRRGRAERVASLRVEGVSGVCSNLDWVGAAQRGGFQVVTGIVAYCLNAMPRSMRPDPYKDCANPRACHQVFPEGLEMRLHPWWARSGSDWLVPQERGVLMAPSSGTLNCFAEAAASSESHTRCSFNRHDILAWSSEIDEALTLVDSHKVNFHYVVWSYGSYPNLSVLDAWLDAGDELVASGQVEWATVAEVLEASKSLPHPSPTPSSP